jgi:hypothetical protein
LAIYFFFLAGAAFLVAGAAFLTAGLVSFFSWWLRSVLRCVTQGPQSATTTRSVERQGRDNVARTVGHQGQHALSGIARLEAAPSGARAAR